ncbi:hypothetical protein GGF32_002371 [Allomyces javanicus]|nr:hypothetical protein GGF32_002371 [Allomyces javanicus]
MPAPMTPELQAKLLNPPIGVWVTLRDGHVVYARTWPVPDGTELIATLTWAHGLGEHINRYDHVFTDMAKAGIQVHAWDQRGFGRTALRNKSQGQIRSWSQVLDDVAEALHRNTVPGKPKFLGGHSMGGLVVLDFLRARGKDAGLAGVIATSPAIEAPPESRAPAFAITVLRLLAHVLPNVTTTPKLDATVLTHDEAVMNEYLADPLVSGTLSFRFTNAMIRGMIHLAKPETPRTLPAEVPLLLTHGTEDKLTYAPGTVTFYERAKHLVDREVKVFDGQRHELHHEPAVRDEVVRTWVEWMKKRVDGPVRQSVETMA